MADGIVVLSSDIIPNMRMEGSSVANLPFDVIFDVFLRLSIEDLMKCQGVCKTWRNLIHRIDFRDMQLKRALSLAPHIILASYSRSGPDCRSSIYLMNNEKCREIPVKGFKLNWNCEITNSCNGLLCIASGDLNDPVYIYNPITRESTKLPKQEHERFKVDGVLYGLGFDQVSKKYKVVCVYRPYYWYTDYIEGYVTEEPVTTGEIITEGEDSWRKLEFPHQIQFDLQRTVFLDGAFHWMISDDYETFGSPLILALDISSEQFQTINIPPSVNIPDCMILTDIAGSLSFVERDSLDTSTQIWRLVGSRADGRCFRQYTCEFISKTGEGKYYCRVLGGCSNGSFLYKATDHIERDPNANDIDEIEAIDHLGVYIPDKKQSFIVDMVGAPACFDTVFFQPTLLSPNSIYFPSKPKLVDEEKGKGRSTHYDMEWLLRKGEAVRKRKERKREKKIARKETAKMLSGK